MSPVFDTAMVPIKEGTLPFHWDPAGKPTSTWYKLCGNVERGHRPLVIVHGEPGLSHLYLTSLMNLAVTYGSPFLSYDQLGCGHSTRLPEKAGDTSFWTLELFIEELDDLLKGLDIGGDRDVLGQSWSAQLAASWAVRQPKGLRRLVLASGISDVGLWEAGAAKLRNQLPEDVQETLEKHEGSGTTDSKEYQDGFAVYYQKHV